MTDIVTETLTPLVEPPVGSVVFDSMDDAWQLRSDGFWYCAIDGDEYSRVGWRQMVNFYGPLVTIYEALGELR